MKEQGVITNSDWGVQIYRSGYLLWHQVQIHIKSSIFFIFVLIQDYIKIIPKIKCKIRNRICPIKPWARALYESGAINSKAFDILLSSSTLSETPSKTYTTLLFPNKFLYEPIYLSVTFLIFLTLDFDHLLALRAEPTHSM